MCLLKASVGKMSVEVNPVYSLNIFNIYLDLSDTLRKALILYLETYWDPQFGKFKVEEKAWGKTYLFHLISQSWNRRLWHILRGFLIQ